MKSIRITDTSLSLVKETLVRPFGFKGFHISELWQAVACVSSDGFKAVCPSTQSVLWSDGNVFSAFTPDKSNLLMYRVTERALSVIKGKSFTRPDILIDSIIPELREYADYICGMKVKTTFILNSLVGVDFALWSLYARENGIDSFDGIIPESTRDAMSCRHSKLAHIPLVSYNVDEAEIRSLLESGTALMKVKIGNTPEWDMQRIEQVHSIAKDYETPLTKSGKVCYYLDANGRYTPEQLKRFVDFIDRKNILERVAIIEEPFPEEDKTDVSDLPVVINADESAHSAEDLAERISLGYRSVALKPIAKTLSVSFAMVEAMHKAGGMYLCADLTVNPLLAEWNKQFASRIAPLSSLNVGCVEVNGDANYVTWDEQKTFLPGSVVYRDAVNGAFVCGDDFYSSGKSLFTNEKWGK